MEDMVAPADDVPPDDNNRRGDSDDDDEEDRIVERDPTGRYGRYDTVLGKGAFKTVYKAFDEVDGIEVAWNQVKVQDVFQSEEELERLYSEVHLLKTLKHKNIIKFYNSWVDTKTKNVNFITEIFTSGTLRQYRKKHKHCDMKALKNWSRQILRGLLYLHSHDPPIIHRDLKCDNIFVNGNQGEVKIGDLGLAAILRHKDAAHSVIGTPEFMAPEFYEEEYNELVDIYAFGMCVLEMVTLEYPYSECQNAAQIYKKVIAGKKPAALDKVNNPEVRAFVEKCLASASRRLPARELLADPFLREPEKDTGDGQSKSRINEQALSSVRSREDIDRTHRSPPKDNSRRESENTPTSPASKGQQGSREGRRSEPEQHASKYAAQRSAEERERLEKMERARSSRDFKVRGKLDDDEQTVFLRLKIADALGHVRQIHFPFNIREDTAFCVASEMVEELDLSDQDVTDIADMIDAEIMKLVPDWKPGPAFDDSVTDPSDRGNELSDRGEQESDTHPDMTSQEGSVTKGERGSSQGKITKARSLSPPSSVPKDLRRGIDWGRAASPVRLRMGTGSPLRPEMEAQGVAHGRFWEGVAFKDLPWTPKDASGFSSEESDNGQQDGSPLKKKKDSSITQEGEKGSENERGGEKKGEEGERGGNMEGEKEGEHVPGEDGDEEDLPPDGGRSPHRSLVWPKDTWPSWRGGSPQSVRSGNRYTMTDFSELMAQVGGSGVAHNRESMLHSQSDLELKRPGPPGWGSTDQLERGYLDDDDVELMREEEDLRLEREHEMQELELRFWQRLMEMRSRHRKTREVAAVAAAAAATAASATAAAPALGGGDPKKVPVRKGESGREGGGHPYGTSTYASVVADAGRHGTPYGEIHGPHGARTKSGQLAPLAEEGNRRAAAVVVDDHHGGKGGPHGSEYGGRWREGERSAVSRSGELGMMEAKGRAVALRDHEWDHRHRNASGGERRWGHMADHRGGRGGHGDDRDRDWDRDSRDYWDKDRERERGGDWDRDRERGRDRDRDRDVDRDRDRNRDRDRDWPTDRLHDREREREWDRERERERDRGDRDRTRDHRDNRDWDRIDRGREWDRDRDRDRDRGRDWDRDRDWEHDRDRGGDRDRDRERDRGWDRDGKWVGSASVGGGGPYRDYWEAGGRGGGVGVDGSYHPHGPPPRESTRSPPIKWDRDRGEDLVQDPEMRRRAEDRSRTSSPGISGVGHQGFYPYGSGEAPFYGVAPHRFDTAKREIRGREEPSVRKGGERERERERERTYPRDVEDDSRSVERVGGYAMDGLRRESADRVGDRSGGNWHGNYRDSSDAGSDTSSSHGPRRDRRDADVWGGGEGIGNGPRVSTGEDRLGRGERRSRSKEGELGMLRAKTEAEFGSRQVLVERTLSGMDIKDADRVTSKGRGSEGQQELGSKAIGKALEVGSEGRNGEPAPAQSLVPSESVIAEGDPSAGNSPLRSGGKDKQVFAKLVNSASTSSSLDSALSHASEPAVSSAGKRTPETLAQQQVPLQRKPGDGMGGAPKAGPRSDDATATSGVLLARKKSGGQDDPSVPGSQKKELLQKSIAELEAKTLEGLGAAKKNGFVPTSNMAVAGKKPASSLNLKPGH